MWKRMTPIDSKSLVELYALLVGIHVLLVIHGKDPRPTNREPLTSGPDGETENGAGCVSVCVVFLLRGRFEGRRCKQKHHLLGERTPSKKEPIRPGLCIKNVRTQKNMVNLLVTWLLVRVETLSTQSHKNGQNTMQARPATPNKPTLMNVQSGQLVHAYPKVTGKINVLASFLRASKVTVKS